jgi:hypothetical protein
MLDYMKQMSSSNQIVAGMHNRFNGRADWLDSKYGVQGPATFTNYATQLTGKAPGLWSGDFSFDDNAQSNKRWEMTYEAERQYNKGALVNIMYHVSQRNTCFYIEAIGTPTCSCHLFLLLHIFCRHAIPAFRLDNSASGITIPTAQKASCK